MYAIIDFLRKNERKKLPMKNSVCSFVLMLLCIVLAVAVAIFGISGIGLKSVMAVS